MYCQACGTHLPEPAQACPSCKTVTAQSEAAGAWTSSARAEELRSAGREALGVWRRLAMDPVGRLVPTYEELGEARALRVGLVSGGSSVLLLLLGGYWLLPFHDELWDFLGFSGLLRGLACCALPFLGTLAGTLIAGRLAGSAGGLGAACFLSGIAVLPLALASLLCGLLGYERYGAIAVLLLFASVLGVLVLHVGYTRIARISERTSSLAVPAVLVLVFGLARSLLGSLLGDLGGL